MNAFRVVVVLVALLASPPAAAEEPGVVLNRYDVAIVPLGVSGYYVDLVCNASADPGEFGDVAVGTMVGCSVTGATNTVTRSQGLPGHEAFTRVSGTFLAPVRFCIWGEAAFAMVNADDIVSVSAGIPCVTLRS